MPNAVTQLDDLQYDWPVDVLHYEAKLFLGLSFQDVLIVAVPTVLPMLFHHFMVGVVGAILGYLLVRKFEGLGDRNVLAYLLARLRAQVQAHSVALPLILPAEPVETVVITDLDGHEIARIGGIDS
ncbi:MAG: hypothetical protein HUU38_28920 [Anaerolineales bacterium]|nr:hypothetical protein [Anaerolineales bacterium]